MPREKKDDSSEDQANRSQHAVTVRLGDEMFDLLHLLAAERKASLSETVKYVLDEWWRQKPDRPRYDQFLRRGGRK